MGKGRPIGLSAGRLDLSVERTDFECPNRKPLRDIDNAVEIRRYFGTSIGA